ncbi:hypothetical protein E3G44_004364 [Mycobacteroides abscessus]|uniref:HNH/ENDO VII supernuclease with conserved GHE residues family protein n=1 Tax=Mycobacteroides abscessus 21 TaxID=1299324 RepID=A0A829Q8D9_9MYCO|nr:HNH/ENDO VII supernuclease with conserved GHE residues family protein [Mycobacteroides abscessus 21]MBE5496859.1 hypothetical protein [Mycobacteroides abscessus]
MAIQFDIGAVKASAWEFGNVAGFTRSGVENIAKLLGDSSGMAGTDAPGQKFAKDYDALAKAAVELGATSVNGLSKAAQLLHATAVNHENADTQSALNNKALPAMPPPAAVTVTAPAIPSALGGTEPPSWWSTIKDHVGGAAWPNGDPAKLRDAGNHWNVTANAMSDHGLQLDRPGYFSQGEGPIGNVATQVSPEIPQVMDNLTKARESIDDVAGAFHAAGMACIDFAKNIEDVHNSITKEMLILGGTVVATEAVSKVLIPLTLGGSEVVSKLVDTSRIVATGERVAAILAEYRVLAEASTFPALAAAANAARSVEMLRPLASANVSLLAAEGAGLMGAEAAGGSLNALYPRPYLRVATERTIQAATRKTADGKYYIVGSDPRVRVLVDRTGQYGADILQLPKTADGKYFIDSNGFRYPVESKWQYGHKYGEEFATWQQRAHSEHWTRQRWNDEMNNPALYEIQDQPGNSAHIYEKTR